MLLSCYKLESEERQINNNKHIQDERGWIHEFPNVGVYSSPRVADLNQDGVKDIVIGAGKLEFQKTDSAVIAISGAIGEILWNVPVRDEIFGSALLLDITQNEIKNVIIGGRSAVLMAINDVTGEILWEFFEDNPDHRITPSDYGWYNFYNPQLIPDQTGNGLEDILISNGGDIMAPPFSEDWPLGNLMIIDSSNGELLIQTEMPDGRETYMSPVVAKMHEDDSDFTIVFGTDGETVGGGLFRTMLSELNIIDLSNSIRLMSCKEKGFIAPPVLDDITLNDYYDIICNAVDGKVIVLDGKKNALIWETKIEDSETYGSLGVGSFTEKNIPDFISTMFKGIWPNFEGSVQIVLDGETGEILLRDSLGTGQISSLVVVDITGNDRDDALMSINFTSAEDQDIIYNNMLVVYDIFNRQVFQAAGVYEGFNLASTSRIDDLDGNGMLDIISIHLTDSKNRFTMNGFRVFRLRTNIELASNVEWGATIMGFIDNMAVKQPL